MTEKIQFECTGCGRTLSVSTKYVGRTFRCPGCGTVDRVPARNPSPATDVSPPPVSAPAAEVPRTGKGVAPQHAGPEKLTKSASRGPAVAVSRTPGPSVREKDFVPVRLKRATGIEPEMDMTPMVDVTFLLLIFFMVTAAYSLQKSLEMPSPERQEEAAESRTIEELESDSDYIIVRIGRDNTVWVNDIEAPSQQEVIARLREARAGGAGTRGPSNLLVLADPEAKHEVVVMVLDAGNAVGMEGIQLACMEEQPL